LLIRWFRWIATTSAADDPAGSGRGFGTERDPARLAFFSDAVFAIAVTLLVLEIRPPQDTRHLLHGLAALWPSYLAYAITFLLIGQVWANHHVMLDHIRAADRTVLFLNTLAAILFNAIWDYARHHHRLLGTTIDWVGASAISRRFRLALVWIATGTLLGALLPVLGMAVIAAFIPYYCVHPLLLAADPGRDRQRHASARRRRSGVTPRVAVFRPCRRSAQARSAGAHLGGLNHHDPPIRSSRRAGRARNQCGGH
jgi:Endosomal/lysosomal potassium channel TMEM175